MARHKSKDAILKMLADARRDLAAAHAVASKRDAEVPEHVIEAARAAWRAASNVRLVVGK